MYVDYARYALETVVALFAIGIGIYACGSFWLMGRHVPGRGLVATLRSLVNEIFVASITQPILPLWYVIGRRMGAGKGVPIIFVHGYMQNRIDFVPLARALARRGIGPSFGFNYPWWGSVESNAARLEKFVARICEETGRSKVDLVCHSLGGLVALEMMRDEAKHEDLKVRRCVTIASPHAGVMWRGPVIGVSGTSLRRGSKLLELQAGVKIAVPCLSVYSTHDNVVFPKESSMIAARGGRDVEVANLGHLAILFSPAVADHVATFLAEPDALPSSP